MVLASLESQVSIQHMNSWYQTDRLQWFHVLDALRTSVEAGALILYDLVAAIAAGGSGPSGPLVRQCIHEARSIQERRRHSPQAKLEEARGARGAVQGPCRVPRLEEELSMSKSFHVVDKVPLLRFAAVKVAGFGWPGRTAGLQSFQSQSGPLDGPKEPAVLLQFRAAGSIVDGRRCATCPCNAGFAGKRCFTRP